jgi:hypothetical protein
MTLLVPGRAFLLPFASFSSSRSDLFFPMSIAIFSRFECQQDALLRYCVGISRCERDETHKKQNNKQTSSRKKNKQLFEGWTSHSNTPFQNSWPCGRIVELELCVLPSCRKIFRKRCPRPNRRFGNASSVSSAVAYRRVAAAGDESEIHNHSQHHRQEHQNQATSTTLFRSLCAD